MTQGAFAEKVGIEATKLSKSLSGTRRFSSLDLALLAEAGGVTVDWLLTGLETKVATAARASVGSSAEVAVSKALEYTTMRSDLAELGYVQRWNLPEPVALTGMWADQGEALAERAVASVKRAGKTIRSDLASLIEEVFEIDVAVQDLGEGFDGLAVATETARLILVNRSSIAARQRFTMAHELGHLLASDDQQVHKDRDIYSRESRRGESEVRANAFAAAFLMPESSLREWLGGRKVDLGIFCQLATEFAVSPSALAYRLEGLRIIDGGTRDRFGSMTGKDAALEVGRSEDFSLTAAKAMSLKAPRSLLRDAFAAYQEGKVTLRPYAQLVGEDPRILRRQLAEGEVVHDS